MAELTTTDTAAVPRSARYQAMNGLRFLSAALIVLFHAHTPGRWGETRSAERAEAKGPATRRRELGM